MQTWEAFAVYQAFSGNQSPAGKSDNAEGQGQREGLWLLQISYLAGFCKERAQDRGCLTSLGPLLAKSPVIQLTWGLVAPPTSRDGFYCTPCGKLGRACEWTLRNIYSCVNPGP